MHQILPVSSLKKYLPIVELKSILLDIFWYLKMNAQ